MSELKPCPFCNCEMEIETVGRDWWRIKPVDGHEDNCPFGEHHEWDCSQQYPEWRAEHIADWNKRAQPTVRDYIKANESDWKKCHRQMVNISSLHEFIRESEE